MSGWISRNLSGLAQQVTTFTKDVITDGNSDPEHALHPVAEERRTATDQHELSQLRQMKQESDHRAESAELQIARMAEEYRKLLTAKESELADLRQQNAHLKDTLMHRPEREGATPSADRLEAGPNENALDEHVDYQEGVLQGEVKRLQGQLARLQNENQKWRQLAESGSSSSTVSAKLTEMEDQHREEIALLQLAHARAMDALRTELATAPVREESPAEPVADSTTATRAGGEADESDEGDAAVNTSTVANASALVESSLQALMAATLAQLQPLLSGDTPPRPLDQEKYLSLVRSTVMALQAKLDPDTLHMDCELRHAQTSQQLGALQSELGALRERMAAAERDHVREKDDLVAKSAALQSTLEALRSRMLVDAQDTAAVEEQLAAAIAREEAHLALVQQLRGELHVADETTRVASRSTTEELQQARAERDRAVGQLDELRRHLLQREKDFTEDAMRRDGQIEYLRQQIKEARGERDAIASGMQGQLAAAASAGDGLRAAITRLTGERNSARTDAAARAAECARLQKSVDNLESVLAAFESERESALSALRGEITSAREESQVALLEVQAELGEAREKIASLEHEIKDMSRIKGELNVARGLQVAAQAQCQALQTQLNEANAKVLLVQKAAGESMIDRKLVANTFVSFVTAPSHRRDDVLRLLASMLGLTDDQQAKVGLTRRGFLHALFTPPPPPASAAGAHNGPIAEEFLNFLLHEAQSTPAPSPAKAFPDTTPTAALRPARGPGTTAASLPNATAATPMTPVAASSTYTPSFLHSSSSSSVPAPSFASPLSSTSGSPGGSTPSILMAGVPTPVLAVPAPHTVTPSTHMHASSTAPTPRAAGPGGSNVGPLVLERLLSGEGK
eukprot:m.7498 g.7498  ORF g.7498 m.7498 type:complete len:864 (+) comp5037_c1_seq1:101-2692(+)